MISTSIIRNIQFNNIRFKSFKQFIKFIKHLNKVAYFNYEDKQIYKKFINDMILNMCHADVNKDKISNSDLFNIILGTEILLDETAYDYINRETYIIFKSVLDIKKFITDSLNYLGLHNNINDYSVIQNYKRIHDKLKCLITNILNINPITDIINTIILRYKKTNEFIEKFNAHKLDGMFTFKTRTVVPWKIRRNINRIENLLNSLDAIFLYIINVNEIFINNLLNDIFKNYSTRSGQINHIIDLLINGNKLNFNIII